MKRVYINKTKTTRAYALVVDTFTAMNKPKLTASNYY